jgi:hypothetical protein
MVKKRKTRKKLVKRAIPPGLPKDPPYPPLPPDYPQPTPPSKDNPFIA